MNRMAPVAGQFVVAPSTRSALRLRFAIVTHGRSRQAMTPAGSSETPRSSSGDSTSDSNWKARTMVATATIISAMARYWPMHLFERRHVLVITRRRSPVLGERRRARRLRRPGSRASAGRLKRTDRSPWSCGARSNVPSRSRRRSQAAPRRGDPPMTGKAVSGERRPALRRGIDRRLCLDPGKGEASGRQLSLRKQPAR